MNRLANILFVLLLFAGTKLNGLPFQMQGIDSRDGLSNSAVLSMFQDEKGFMWLGTYNGLNRYDGKFIESYGLDDKGNYIQSSDIIINIQGNGDDCLWLSSFIGFVKFSKTLGKVVEYYPNYNFPFNLTSNGNGTTCLISKKGYISVYNAANRRFDDVRCPDINPLEVIASFFDQDNRMWIFTNTGQAWIAKVTQAGSEAKEEKPTISLAKIRLSADPTVAAFKENGTIFYVTQHGGLHSYHIGKKENRLIRNISDLTERYGAISAIITYHNDIWLSFKGSGVVKLVQSRKYAEEIIDLTTGAFCLHKDTRQDIVWIGSDGKGAIVYSKKNTIFNTIKSGAFPFAISKPIRAIYTDRHNALWVGTKGDGLLRVKDYDKIDDRKIPAANVTRFTKDNGLSNNQVFLIAGSRFHNLNWLGTEGPGISYFSYHDNKVHTMPNHTATPIRKVHGLTEENDSVLWLSTAGYGLQRVVHRNLQITKVTSFAFRRNSKVVNDLFSVRNDGKGFLWIGSRGDGVIRFNMKSHRYSIITSGQKFNSPTDDILSVHKSMHSHFYFGSCAGLLRLAKDGRGAFVLDKIVNEERGGVKEMIHGMQEDDTGCLWFSTTRGLEKYNPQNRVFHKYLKNTGLDVVEFSDNADYKCPYTNRIFFGGIDGIVWIEQSTPIKKELQPPVLFSHIVVDGLKRSIQPYLRKGKASDLVELPYSQNSFSVGFVAIDFVRGNSIEYLYQLENYDKGWLNAGEANEAKFNSLPPGKYTLKVKYKYDVFDEESSKFYVLPIVVLPPWYLSGIALLTYFMVATGLLALLVRYIRRRHKKNIENLNREIEERNREELYQSKMRFFANVTHEFLTPLTLIQGPCERILEYTGADSYVKRYAALLKVNSERLQSLIHEIISFSRQEEFPEDILRIEKILLNDLLKTISIAFSEAVERGRIQFDIAIDPEVYWNTDVASINKILSNLISNAFKYTPANGKICVSIQKLSDKLRISVRNTGKGIKPKEIETLFDRFRILDNMEKNSYMDFSSRNGLGLAVCYAMIQRLKGTIEVKSESEGYTDFTVELPPLELPEVPRPAILENPATSLGKVEEAPRVKSKNGKKPKILVLDDNKEIVWMISEMMQHNYDILEAYRVEEAFSLLEQELPELIVSDLMIPGEHDGNYFVKKLKANKFTAHIPVIIISAKSSIEDQIVGLEYGADFYLTKPFNLGYLRTTIEKLIDRHGALEEYYNSPLSAVELKSGQLIHQEDSIFLQQVRQLIDKYLGEGEIRAEFLATQLKMSNQAFYRKLKSITALPPTDFIKKYRFSIAAKLLLSSNLSVQEVIYRVGINNRSYFYREFSKLYGCTPKEYRALHDADSSE